MGRSCVVREALWGIVALIVLVTVMGCSAMQERPVRHAGCANWIDDNEGGFCAETDAEADRKHRSSLGDGGGGSGGVGSSSSVSSGSTGGSSSQQSSVYSGGDLDCDDFASRAEAQAYLEANSADADYLDGDGDGIACEWGT
jgi:hypothetical protein